MKNPFTITFKPSRKQWEAWEKLTDQTTTEIGFGGSAHGGKSYLGSFFLLSSCLAYPDTGWLLGRKELVNLKRTTLLTFYKLCQEYNIIPDRDFTFNQQQNIITFANQSQIFLLDLSYQPSDPLYTRLGGLELTGAFVDQSEEIPAEAIDILKTRLGRRHNDKYHLLPKLFETFNPSKGHVYQRYYKPWKERSLPSYRAFIKALPTDNPYTSQEYLDQLRRGDKVTVMRLLHGNFEYDDDPATLCQYDAILDLPTNHVPESSDRYLIGDIARYGSDRIVLTFWEGLRSYKVRVFQKLGIDQTAALISQALQEERIPYSHCLVDADGVGGGVMDILRGIKGFVANARALFSATQGKPDNYANLKAQCGYKLADLINTHQLAIRWEDETLQRQLTEELEQLKAKDIDRDGKRQLAPKEEVKEILGRSPDLLDCLLMRMFFELQPIGTTRRARVYRPDYRRVGYGTPRPVVVKLPVAKPL